MKQIIKYLSISLLVGCGNSPDPVLQPESPLRKSHRSACYQGPLQKYDTCLATESIIQNHQDFEYPDPFQDDFPQHRSPFQYIAPSFFVNIATINLETALAPNFTLNEFLSLEKGPYGIISPQVLDKIQSIREMAKGPVRITSGYRSPGYNQNISGSAKWSRHMYGDAVDFYSGTASLDELIQYCKKNGASFYQKYESHVHCDWRDLPLPSGFYQYDDSKLPPASGFNSLKAYHAHSKIESVVNKRSGSIQLSAQHPEQEDSGRLIYEWKITNRRNQTLLFSTPTVEIDAAQRPIHIELRVGGSIVVHKNMTW